MSRPGRGSRVALASAVDGELVLGDAGARHVRWLEGGVELRGDTRRLVPWTDVAAVEIDAPTTRARHPGALSTALATALAAVGFDWLPSTADFDVDITTADGVISHRCDGYVGGGYPAHQVQGLQLLARALTEDATLRRRLNRPEPLLAAVAATARPGLDDATLRVRLVAAISGPPSP